MNTRITAILLGLTVGLPACGAARPTVLDNAKAMVKGKEVDDLAPRQPLLVKEAQEQYAKAETAQDQGDTEEATLRAYTSMAKVRTARNFVSRAEARTMARAKAEADEAVAGERKKYEALDARLKQLMEEKSKVAKPSPDLEPTKRAIVLARDKQADAIKEGAPAKAEAKYGEGKRLVENAVEAFSLNELKDAKAAAERAVSAFDAAIAIARAGGKVPPAPEMPTRPTRPEPRDEVADKPVKRVDDKEPSRAAGNFRGLAETRIVELQLKKTEMLGQLRDESCKGPFREFDATLDLAQKRFDARDYERALEFAIRASERLRPCEGRTPLMSSAPPVAAASSNAAAVAAEKERAQQENARKQAAQAIAKAQEELARAQSVLPEDPKVTQGTQLIARAESWFDRQGFAEAEGLAKQADKLLEGVKVDPKAAAKAKTDDKVPASAPAKGPDAKDAKDPKADGARAQARDNAQRAIEQTQERIARAVAKKPEDQQRLATAKSFLESAERSFDRAQYESVLLLLQKARVELDKIAPQDAASQEPPATADANWKRAYEKIQDALRARDAAKPSEGTRDAFSKAQQGLERARAEYAAKNYPLAEKDASAALAIFESLTSGGAPAVGAEPTKGSSEPTKGNAEPGSSGTGVRVGGDAAGGVGSSNSGDWNAAYRKITETLRLRDRVAPHLAPDDKATWDAGSLSLSKARGAYQAKEFTAASAYAEAAASDFARVMGEAKKRGAQIAEETKVDARKAEDELREAKIALELCQKQHCDDRDTEKFVRGKSLVESAARNFDAKDFAYTVNLATQAKRMLGEALASPRKNEPPVTDPKAQEKLRNEAETELREVSIAEELCKQRECARFDQENTMRATQLLRSARQAFEAKPARDEQARDLAKEARTLYRATLDKMPKFRIPDGISRVSLKGEQLFMAPSIEFNTGNSKIAAASQPTILDLAQVLKANKDVVRVVRLIGHTDNRGNAAANKGLSQARAQAVMNALVNQGVPAGILAFEGKGGEAPIADNATEAGRKINRRIEALIELK